MRNSAVVVQDTTCVNVVDRKGNFFSATPSGAWLPSVIAGEHGHSVQHAAAVVRRDRRGIPISLRPASARA